MGIIQHHAIVVTGYDKYIKDAHKAASIIFPQLPILTPLGVNAYQSFFIPPDGSKEGWEESNEGDKRREELKIILRGLRVDWVEVSYGEFETTIVEAS